MAGRAERPFADVDPKLVPATFQSQQGALPDGVWPEMVMSDALNAIAAGEITAGAPFAVGCYEISYYSRKG